MKILVLDDDQHLLEAVKMILSQHGHEVEATDSIPHATKLVQSEEYDFVLVDYRMPEGTGISFMENAEIPRKTKVLLTTAFANRDLINRMFELGASGYLIKPFGEEDLLHHLDFHSRSSERPLSPL